MNAHKVEVVLAEDGVLVLKGLPFRAGDMVEAIVIELAGPASNLDCPQKLVTNLYPLQGKQPYRYDMPFEPATSLTDWEALS
jgi:hypothetical protein